MQRRSGNRLRLRVYAAVVLAAAFIEACTARRATPIDHGQFVTPKRLAFEIDAALEHAVADGFGGAIVVSKADHVLLAKGYGLAARRARIPFTTHTLAPISSVTKVFTALAIVQLAADGRVQLDQPLKTYLPTMAEPAASVLIRDVLLHYAGLPEYCGDDFDRLTRAGLLATCAAAPLVVPRGEFNYSNPGYSYLGALVEVVSGQSWEDYLRQRVFVPAGMTTAGFLFTCFPEGRFARGYLHDQPQAIEAAQIAALRGEVWNLKGSGGLQASVDDMRRFFEFLVKQREPIRSAMLTAHASDGGAPGVQAGYGFAIRSDRDGRAVRVSVSGSDDVFLSYFMWLPRSRVFMYFVGNSGEEHVRPILREVVMRLVDADRLM